MFVARALETLVILLPDAGPLITLAYADALDLLLKPGWPVQVVDMVLHEVTRNATPTSEKIGQWVADRSIPVRTTRTFQHYLAAQSGGEARRHANPISVKSPMQEAMNELALADPRHDRGIPVRRPQDRPRQLPAAGQLPQDQYAGLAVVSGGQGLARLRRRGRAGGDFQWAKFFTIKVSALKSAGEPWTPRTLQQRRTVHEERDRRSTTRLEQACSPVRPRVLDRGPRVAGSGVQEARPVEP